VIATMDASAAGDDPAAQICASLLHSESWTAGRLCRPGDCADLVRGRPGRTGLQAAEVGTIREAPAAACGTELRHRKLTCEATHGWPEAKPHRCQRFHSNRGAEDRGSSTQILPAIAPRRRSAAGHPDRIAPMSPVGISRCATHVVSRSAQSGDRHNRRSRAGVSSGLPSVATGNSGSKAPPAGWNTPPVS